MQTYDKYHYSGPQYYFGNKIAASSNLYTMARSFSEARKNFIYKIANGDITTRYDIVDDFITLVKPESPKVKRDKCDRCGYELNDMGDCPVCDYGEYDLLDLED